MNFKFLAIIPVVTILASPCLRADSGSSTNAAQMGATIVSLDPADPQACARFHDFLKKNEIDLTDAKLRDALESEICDPQPGPGKVVSIVLLKSDDSSGDDDSKPTLEMNVGTEIHSGNENYLHVNGEFSFNKQWGRNLVHVNGEGEYESDSDVGRAVISADYAYDLTSHWALFAYTAVKHDNERALGIGTEEYGGGMYDVFPYSEYSTRALVFSAGVGHRFDDFHGGYVRNDMIASYRAQYVQKLAEELKLMTAIWYQQVLYAAPTSTKPARALDFSDYRVLFQLQLQVGKDDGWHATFGFEDEYWSDPRPGTVNNDVRITAGLGYTFK